MWWGYSQALDLLSELKHHQPEIKMGEDSELNILLIGAGDARHILKTLAQLYRHADRKHLKIYVMEASLELVARQLLLITIALQPEEELGLLQKTRLFMEIYGNSLLRPTSNDYLSKISSQLIHVITDADYQKQVLPFVNLDLLKYRERDYLETIFKFWEKKGNNIFNITELWDKRLRKHLNTRYDSRHGVFDWDYHMRLHPCGGQSIKSQEYKYWRETGVAFTWLETEFSKPNCSLASGVVQIGDTLCHHGYLGDIVSSPHVVYGLDCEDGEMLRSVNGTRAKRATDITERNLMRMFAELKNQQPYHHHQEDSDVIYIAQPAKIREYDEQIDDTINRSASSSQFFRGDTHPLLPVFGATVTFLPLNAANRLPHLSRFQDLFDTVYISQNMFKHFNESVLQMARDGALVLQESRKMVLTFHKEQLSEFACEVDERAKQCCCVPISPFDPVQHEVATFVVKRDVAT